MMSLFKLTKNITYQPFKTLPAVKKKIKKGKKKAVQLNGSKQQIIIP
jgi:hypothetical protein